MINKLPSMSAYREMAVNHSGKEAVAFATKSENFSFLDNGMHV